MRYDGELSSHDMGFLIQNIREICLYRQLLCALLLFSGFCTQACGWQPKKFHVELSIRFARGESALSDSNKMVLARKLPDMNALTPHVLLISGFADSKRTARNSSLQRALALARANAVRQFYVDAGFPKDRIYVEDAWLEEARMGRDPSDPSIAGLVRIELIGGCKDGYWRTCDPRGWEEDNIKPEFNEPSAEHMALIRALVRLYRDYEIADVSREVIEKTLGVSLSEKKSGDAGGSVRFDIDGIPDVQVGLGARTTGVMFVRDRVAERYAMVSVSIRFADARCFSPEGMREAFGFPMYGTYNLDLGRNDWYSTTPNSSKQKKQPKALGFGVERNGCVRYVSVVFHLIEPKSDSFDPDQGGVGGFSPWRSYSAPWAEPAEK